MKLNRRSFLASSLLASIAPGFRVSFAQEQNPNDVLVVFFARGGWDGLQLVAPADLGTYQDQRPSLAVQTRGNNAGTLMRNGIGGVDFFLHPDAKPLHNLYNSGDLAVIHAAGMPTTNRSHFKSMDLMERGLSDNEDILETGWLTRHINSLPGKRSPLSTASISWNNAVSLLGYSQTLSIPDVHRFRLPSGQITTGVIRALCSSGESPYQQAALNTLEAVDTVQSKLRELESSQTEDEDTTTYTDGHLSKYLRNLATLIKLDVGLDIATVDYGGWDHHNNLISEFRRDATEFSKSFAAFWDDVKEHRDRITVLMMTEFGRRVYENGSEGTDHGSGGVMMVLSGNANGGRIYGEWPGIRKQDQTDGDMLTTTDYRQVISEVLVKRHNNQNLEAVFPTVTYSPLGVINANPTS